MTSSETPTMMLDRLADAAWEQLADLSPRAIHIDDIAADAGIPAPAARAVAGSISNQHPHAGIREMLQVCMQLWRSSKSDHFH